jgi:TetR/AcrR family tetracycline transcriptional repressor
MVAILREAGLSGRDAVWAVDTLNYFVVGHVIEEQLAASLPDGGAEAAARLAEALDPSAHPNLYATAGDMVAPRPDEHFEHGLRLIVDGVRLTAGCR